jgi:hypothetical protein
MFFLGSLFLKTFVRSLHFYLLFFSIRFKGPIIFCRTYTPLKRTRIGRGEDDEQKTRGSFVRSNRLSNGHTVVMLLVQQAVQCTHYNL